jgi:myo-inositol 2-dehydrogenase/D-chiro-inositol 1-dehydrogenase
MAKVVNIGLIGAGRIGKLHGNNLVRSVRGAKIEAVADVVLTDEHRCWAEGYGIKKIYTDPTAIMVDKNIDAVFICSSTDSHADLIIAAAKAGKHIFCEKPIHTDVQVIKKALDEVKKAGVKLQVGFVRRFDHNHKKVRDTVASGEIGKPHIIKVTSRDPEPQPLSYVATSGGIFMDMTIHDFDMVRFLSGSEVTEVTAYGSVLIDPAVKQFGDVDTAIVMMKFENGALGVIDNSRAARYGYDQRTEVHCDKGCVQVANDLKDTSMISTAGGVFCERPTWFFLERYNDAFIAEAQAFVDSVANDTEPLVTGIDGLMAVYVAKAADLSLQENRPVKLSELL